MGRSNAVDIRRRYRAVARGRLLTVEGGEIAIAFDDVAGFVNVVFDPAEQSGEIYMIAVDPRAQRQGIATAPTELALHEMRARGLTLAIVATGGDEGHAPARATYEKAGFTGCPQVWYAKRLD